MATLLSICQSALREIGDFAVPSAIVGSTDPIAVQLLALAQRSGKTLAADHKWQVLLKTYTFPTVASTATYALPTDFKSFANITQWDRTNYWEVEGPVSPQKFEALRSSSVSGITSEKINGLPQASTPETQKYATLIGRGCSWAL